MPVVQKLTTWGLRVRLLTCGSTRRVLPCAPVLHGHDALPHRPSGRELRFRAAEVRDWLAEMEADDVFRQRPETGR